jgi:hypothetical protein
VFEYCVSIVPFNVAPADTEVPVKAVADPVTASGVFGVMNESTGPYVVPSAFVATTWK